MSQEEANATGDPPERPVASQPRRSGGEGRRRGLVIVNTGHGKGKTTAALGVVLRAWGRGMQVVVFQYLKHTGARFGEHRAVERIGIPIHSLGDGFTWLSKDPERTAALAVEQWGHAREAILGGGLDLVVLDEFTYPLHYGWIPVADVLDVLRRRPPDLHVIVTGRYAPQELVDMADLVTEMREVKHPYRDQGLKAQPGIDF